MASGRVFDPIAVLENNLSVALAVLPGLQANHRQAIGRLQQKKHRRMEEPPGPPDVVVARRTPMHAAQPSAAAAAAAVQLSLQRQKRQRGRTKLN